MVLFLKQRYFHSTRIELQDLYLSSLSSSSSVAPCNRGSTHESGSRRSLAGTSAQESKDSQGIEAKTCVGTWFQRTLHRCLFISRLSHTHPKTVVVDCTPPCSRDKRVSRCPRSACRSVPQEGDFDCYRKRESSSQNDKPCTSRAMIEQLDQNHTISSKPSNVRM